MVLKISIHASKAGLRLSREVDDVVLSTMALEKGKLMCLGEVYIHQLNESIFVRFQKICQLKLDFCCCYFELFW